MWNLRNKTDEHMGREGGEGRGRIHKRLLMIENKLWVDGGQVGGRRARWVMGTKEGTCDEQWVLYVSDESLNSIPEANIAMYVNQLEFK